MTHIKKIVIHFTYFLFIFYIFEFECVFDQNYNHHANLWDETLLFFLDLVGLELSNCNFILTYRLDKQAQYVVAKLQHKFSDHRLRFYFLKNLHAQKQQAHRKHEPTIAPITMKKMETPDRLR